MRKLIFILLVTFLFSCNSARKYQADWIIVELKYDENNLYNFVHVRNLTINFREGGFVPTVSKEPFIDEKFDYEESFSFFQENEKDYITIEGSKFFTDTFEVGCLTKNCCEIFLKNEKNMLD